MHRITPIVVLVVMGLGLATPASADLTAFLGTTTSPENRAARGAALGVSLVIIGFEFEYSNTEGDETSLAPSLRSGMFNLLLQTPFAVSRLQFYATVGGGMYRERRLDQQDTGLGTNVGGGVKISLAGPLRLRLDYRAFRLGEGTLHRTPQRVYAGLNLAF